MRTNRRLVTIVSAILLIAGLVLPMSASAGRYSHRIGFMFVPRNTTQDYTLTVGEVSVTIPAGALPHGGPVLVHVVTDSAGRFRADFLPDYTFAKPVLMEFGDAPFVYYHAGTDLIRIETSDVDGDGDVGEVWMGHFSRYSGWF